MTSHRSLTIAFVSLLALEGCTTAQDPDSGSAAESTAAAEPAAFGAAVRVEQAERSLDVGRDVASAKAALEAVATDKTAPAELRDRAALSLSRACEMLNDKEGATSAVESLLAAHSDDHRWPGADAAERRLRKLLTGKEEGPASIPRPDSKVAPFAKALAAYFPAKKEQPVEILILGFGGDRHSSDLLGTFNIADALHKIADDACPLCDTKIKAHTMSSWSGSWAAIPAEKSRMNGAMTVFYTHLQDPIPARYDSLLPASMAEVLPHLQKGEGVVIAKERAGAPPSILIAAPREAQLAEVEEALSQMKALPGSLTAVKVTAHLMADEIRSVVRTSGMPVFRACYESLLSRVPGAAGKADIGFGIKGDGSVEDPKIDTTDGFGDATFQQCMSNATSALHFATTGQTTTVKYPVEFSP